MKHYLLSWIPGLLATAVCFIIVYISEGQVNMSSVTYIMAFMALIQVGRLEYDKYRTNKGE